MWNLAMNTTGRRMLLKWQLKKVTSWYSFGARQTPLKADWRRYRTGNGSVQETSHLWGKGLNWRKASPPVPLQPPTFGLRLQGEDSDLKPNFRRHLLATQWYRCLITTDPSWTETSNLQVNVSVTEDTSKWKKKENFLAKMMQQITG